MCSEQSYLTNVRETRQLENDIADLEHQHAELKLGFVYLTKSSINNESVICCRLDRITQIRLQRDLEAGQKQEEVLSELILYGYRWVCQQDDGILF